MRIIIPCSLLRASKLGRMRKVSPGGGGRGGGSYGYSSSRRSSS